VIHTHVCKMMMKKKLRFSLGSVCAILNGEVCTETKEEEGKDDSCTIALHLVNVAEGKGNFRVSSSQEHIWRRKLSSLPYQSVHMPGCIVKGVVEELGK